jgi:hypothetical protein
MCDEADRKRSRRRGPAIATRRDPGLRRTVTARPEFEAIPSKIARHFHPEVLDVLFESGEPKLQSFAMYSKVRSV